MPGLLRNRKEARLWGQSQLGGKQCHQERRLYRIVLGHYKDVGFYFERMRSHQRRLSRGVTVAHIQEEHSGFWLPG